MAESENSDALDQRHDVSFRVLEPRSLGAAGGQDAILVCLWHVVLLKLDAARLQLRDVVFDVLDLPERLARLGGAGVRRRVQEARGTFGELVDYAAGCLLLGLEAPLLLIELTRAGDVHRWYIRIHWGVLQHGAPLGLFRGNVLPALAMTHNALAISGPRPPAPRRRQRRDCAAPLLRSPLEGKSKSKSDTYQEVAPHSCPT